MVNYNDYARGQTRQREELKEGLLTESGHPIASFVKQLKSNYEQGVGSAEHGLEGQELLKRDQPDRQNRTEKERERRKKEREKEGERRADT